jgi:hypothetical protein
MIPRNHDQVSLGGHIHCLPSLANSFWIDLDNNESNTSVNDPLIFSHPTKFMSTFFIPHIHDNTIMESILSSSAAENATGAYMNDFWLYCKEECHHHASLPINQFILGTFINHIW